MNNKKNKERIVYIIVISIIYILTPSIECNNIRTYNSKNNKWYNSSMNNNGMAFFFSPCFTLYMIIDTLIKWIIIKNIKINLTYEMGSFVQVYTTIPQQYSILYAINDIIYPHWWYFYEPSYIYDIEIYSYVNFENNQNNMFEYDWENNIRLNLYKELTKKELIDYIIQMYKIYAKDCVSPLTRDTV